MVRPLGKKWVACPCGITFKRDSRRYKYCCVECSFKFQYQEKLQCQREYYYRKKGESICVLPTASL